MILPTVCNNLYKTSVITITEQFLCTSLHQTLLDESSLLKTQNISN
uniref:Uncharacterized protein n=1 Tax=viral metagenome TaxID=1070528 RepID=A0A6C0JTK0_9ZZZZ